MRLAVFARDGGCLLRFGQVPEWGPCFGPATPHHLLKASQGGAYDDENVVCLCAAHNDMVEDRPLEARMFGLVVLPGRIDHTEAAARRARHLQSAS